MCISQSNDVLWTFVFALIVVERACVFEQSVWSLHSRLSIRRMNNILRQQHMHASEHQIKWILGSKNSSKRACSSSRPTFCAIKFPAGASIKSRPNKLWRATCVYRFQFFVVFLCWLR
jgi:hypothetical protein